VTDLACSQQTLDVRAEPDPSAWDGISLVDVLHRQEVEEQGVWRASKARPCAQRTTEVPVAWYEYRQPGRLQRTLQLAVGPDAGAAVDAHREADLRAGVDQRLVQRAVQTAGNLRIRSDKLLMVAADSSTTMEALHCVWGTSNRALHPRGPACSVDSSPACGGTGTAARTSSRCLAAKSSSAIRGPANSASSPFASLSTRNYQHLLQVFSNLELHSNGKAPLTIPMMSRMRQEALISSPTIACSTLCNTNSERTMRPWPADAAASAHASASRAARCLCLGGGCGRRSSQSRTPRRACCCVPVPSACTGRFQRSGHTTCHIGVEVWQRSRPSDVSGC